MANHGPKLEREQVLLGRFVDIGTELFAMLSSCARAQQMLENKRSAPPISSPWSTTSASPPPAASKNYSAPSPATPTEKATN